MKSTPRCLKLVEVINHVTRVQALLDSGAVPYLFFSKLMHHLSIETNVSTKRITAANEYVTGTMGALLILKVASNVFQSHLVFL